MAHKKSLSDRELFMAALAIYDRPEAELHDKPLDEDADIDAFVDRAFGNVTIPPM